MKERRMPWNHLITRGGLIAEANADVVLNECIDNATQTAGTDSAVTTTLIDVKRTAFAAKRN
jgi:hypothetical protein